MLSVASIKPPTSASVVSELESVLSSSLPLAVHVTTPQDTLAPALYSASEPSGSYVPLAIPFHWQHDSDFNSSQSEPADNILSMTNNPLACHWQPYSQYANNGSDQSCDFTGIPSSSTGMDYCDEQSQQWLESLDPNTPLSYNDIMLYAEITGTLPGSDETTSHFLNYANDPHNHSSYM